MYTVYLITNTVNQMKYVGITEQHIQVRLHFHLNSTSKNPNHGPKFQKDLEEYGKEVYIIEPLAINLTEDLARKLERYYIEYYDTVRNGLNMRYGSEIGSIYHSKELECIKEDYIQGMNLLELANKYNGNASTMRSILEPEPFYRPVIKAAGGWYYLTW